MTASNKTLIKAMERCDKRIAQAKNKKRYSRNEQDRIDALETIRLNESNKIRIQQQISFNSAMKAAK